MLQDKRLQHVKFCRCASELMLQSCYSHVTVLQSCYCITELMKEPVLHDKRLQHVKFCRCASELMLQSCYGRVTALQS